MVVENFSGLIAGYDPGGNDGHGLAFACFRAGECEKVCIETHRNAQSVIDRLEGFGQLSAIGIDTLAAWSTGDSGWRVADLWLRRTYKKIHSSVVSPNGLFGSMGLNGMATLISLRQKYPDLVVTETHPKVLYWALSQTKYNYAESRTDMDTKLSKWLGVKVETKNDHEWDAVVSVLASFKGVSGRWGHDLFKESGQEAGRLVFPAGPAQYWWPE